MIGGGLGAEQEATGRMGQLLRERLPQGVSRIVLRVLGMTTTYAEFETIYVLPDNSGKVVSGADAALQQAAVNVRQAMYREPGGTWFGATFHYFDSGRMSADFTYDEEPEWGRKPDPGVYVADLAAFPRAPHAIPAWLGELVR